MKIEVLVVRDPDASNEVTVFVDGQQVDAAVHDVDPGRGWTRSAWNEAVESVRTDEGNYSPAFRESCLAALEAFEDNEFITEDDDIPAMAEAFRNAGLL